MTQKITFNYETAVKEVFLGDSRSPAVMALSGKVRFISPEAREEACQRSEVFRFLNSAPEDCKNFEADHEILHMLFMARKEVEDGCKHNDEYVKKFMLTLHRIKDERLTYDILGKLVSGLISNKTIWSNAVKMRAGSKYATTIDLTNLLEVAKTEDRPAIFADIEKCTIIEINKYLSANVPNTDEASRLIHNIKKCAEFMYGKNSEAYTKCCQAYDEEKILTPQYSQYIPSMSDADKRTIDALTQENALLRGRVDALVSAITSTKAHAEKCEDAVATLLLAIKGTRSSLLSRGVNAAKAQAKTVYESMQKQK